MANKRVYISGKITGEKELVYKGHFRKAENELIVKHGINPDLIVNPVKFDGICPDFDHDDYMAIDLAALARCDTIYMLNNYQESKGAMEELAFAEENGMKIMYEPEEKPITKKCK